MYSVIIPNKFEDIIQPLLSSIKKFESNPHIVIVSDKHDRDYGYDHIRVNGDFSFSNSVNAGIDCTGSNDVILLNDDVRLTQPTFRKLSEVANSDSHIGMVAPLVDGGCVSVYMQAHMRPYWKKHPIKYNQRLSLICVYIKRSLINSIGKFDSMTPTYGLDDDNFVRRTLSAGWKTAIVGDLIVLHGVGGKTFIRGQNWNSSYIRTDPNNPIMNSIDNNSVGVSFLLSRNYGR